MARARGARSQLAVAFEGTYGTAPGSGYYFAPHSRNGLSEERPLLEDDTLGTRDPGDAAIDVNTVDGEITVPVDNEAFGVWLKAAFGAPTTTNDSGTYTHVFESGAWSLPSLACEKQMPDVPAYHMFAGVGLNRLRFAMQRGGWIDATLGLMGQSMTKASSTAAGSPSSYSATRFRNVHGAIELDASALANVVSAEFDYANNLDAVNTIETNGLIGGLDPLMARLNLNLTLRFASTTLMDTALAGTPVALDLILTRAADEKLTLSIPRLFLPKPRHVIEGPQGIQATFSAQASRQTDGDPMITATLINAVASY